MKLGFFIFDLLLFIYYFLMLNIWRWFKVYYNDFWILSNYLKKFKVTAATASNSKAGVAKQLQIDECYDKQRWRLHTNIIVSARDHHIVVTDRPSKSSSSSTSAPAAASSSTTSTINQVINKKTIATVAYKSRVWIDISQADHSRRRIEESDHDYTCTVSAASSTSGGIHANTTAHLERNNN